MQYYIKPVSSAIISKESTNQIVKFEVQILTLERWDKLE